MVGSATLNNLAKIQTDGSATLYVLVKFRFSATLNDLMKSGRVPPYQNNRWCHLLLVLMKIMIKGEEEKWLDTLRGSLLHGHTSFLYMTHTDYIREGSSLLQ